MTSNYGRAVTILLTKISSFGWKVKIVIGWATDRDIRDGIHFIDSKGNLKLLTAIPGSDELVVHCNEPHHGKAGLI